MGPLELFVRTVGHPLLLTYRHQTGIMRYLRIFRHLWPASHDTLEHHRFHKLKAILKHASDTSRFYRERFKDAGFDYKNLQAPEGIAALPFLTKDDLNASMDWILSNRYSRSDLTVSSTGGSSGVPLTFYRDREVTCVRRAQDYLFNELIGIYPGTKRAWVWGSPLDTLKLDTFKARVANFLGERAVHFYSFDADNTKIRDFLLNLNKHNPRAVFAYPNMLAALAEFAKGGSMNMHKIPKVVVTAEPLYDWQRDLFKEVFQAETFERYGSREIGTVASEGPEHAGMRICEPSYYLEVVDARGKPVTQGEMGELVVTDLYNKGMPLIRYRTGDMVTIAEPLSGSESIWRRITAVGGRIVDLVYRADGSRIAGEAIIMSLRTAGVRNKVQVVQHDPSSLTVKHLYSEAISPEVRSALQDKINEILGGNVEIEYQPVAELPYDKSGKYRYVTSEYRKAPAKLVDR